ncbi:MAG: hypothetical protein D8M57_14105 [Candidatus Scalindua sp. AMX11]|nr:MAG: hypothetical protein DWQ00_09380 [Candidatus Scalindua sp.]NOG83577.1 hypothetical protein [Planctomycetota bacterium]RZV70921.1 MAG: hypothetical protein EX341_15060 [Candidatus Scalindua sp. SCAELEC01]TDE64227.1 MAG: hypothetical protein D8M57_14105 [Candidatus Scalindua sp. AMX11]GJQ59980.1 MAG: hypothetical protein SCALA701_27810 [Candidatus Scalindua sp.]
MARGLSKSATSNKLFITFFLVLMGGAFSVSCVSFYERTSFAPKKTFHHYNGNEGAYDDELEYEQNDELLQEGFLFPKTYREILEITHVHAFAIPLITFVMSRIFSMTLTREWIKVSIYSLAFTGNLLNLSGPWLIRFKSSAFSLSLITSYYILGFCFLCLTTLPLYEMWFKPKESGTISK